jgi:hypothetical protein
MRRDGSGTGVAIESCDDVSVNVGVLELGSTKTMRQGLVISHHHHLFGGGDFASPPAAYRSGGSVPAPPTVTVRAPQPRGGADGHR